MSPGGGGESDWRLTVRFRSDRQRSKALRALSECAAAASAEDRAKTLVSVRRDGPWLRLYASSFDALGRAQQAIFSAVSELDTKAEERLERLDHDSGDWIAVNAPLLSEIQRERITIHDRAGPWGAIAEDDRVTVQLIEKVDRDLASHAEVFVMGDGPRTFFI